MLTVPRASGILPWSTGIPTLQNKSDDYSFYMFHKKCPSKYWYIFVVPGCIKYLIWCASIIISSFRSSTSSTHNMFLKNQHTLQNLEAQPLYNMPNNPRQSWIIFLLFFNLLKDGRLKHWHASQQTPPLSDCSSTSKSGNSSIIDHFAHKWANVTDFQLKASTTA